MAWIESHQSLLTHRKTGRLARALGIPKVYAVGHLHAFWWWCMDNAQTGSLKGLDPEEIAEAACWEGDPKAFVSALENAGFLDRSEDSLSVHDWKDYAGKLIEKRKSDRERKKYERRPMDVPPTSDGNPMDVAGTNQPTNQPTVPTNQEKNPPGDDVPPKPFAWIANKSGNPTAVSLAQVEEWLFKFPGVDVRNDVRRLMEWCRKHPRPAEDDHVAWLEAKLVQRYEEVLAKRLPQNKASPGGMADDPKDAEELATLARIKAEAEARNERHRRGNLPDGQGPMAQAGA